MLSSTNGTQSNQLLNKHIYGGYSWDETVFRDLVDQCFVQNLQLCCVDMAVMYCKYKRMVIATQFHNDSKVMTEDPSPPTTSKQNMYTLRSV